MLTCTLSGVVGTETMFCDPLPPGTATAVALLLEFFVVTPPTLGQVTRGTRTAGR
jgi:hypothetical protein